MAEILTAVERQQAIQRAVDGWGEMDCRYGDREEIIAEEVERAVVSRLAAMGGELPPLPATDWLLHMPAQQDMRDYGRAALARGVAAGTAAERERNAERAVAIGHLSQVNALRAERDALATLLQRAFAALTEWHCEHGTVPESDAVLLHDIRCEIDIDAALAAKGQSNG
jgi:hypothetical protein